MFIPKEVSLGEVYLPPMLVAVAIAYALAMITMLGLERFEFAKNMHAPALIELSLIVIYSIVLSELFIVG